MTLPDKCSRCKAPLIWCLTVTGKKIAVNMVKPVRGGDIVLESVPGYADPVARYVTAGEGTHIAHWCPNPNKPKNEKQGGLPGIG